MNETFFNDDGKPEQFADFDWDAIEPDQRPTVEAKLRKATATAIGKFAKQLIQVGGRTQRQFFIAAHCMAFAAHIHPNQDQTGEQTAASLGEVKCKCCGNVLHKGVTKENFFRRVNQWRDILKLPHVAGAWKQSSRQSIKQATTQNHEKRKQQRSSGIAGFIVKANSVKGD